MHMNQKKILKQENKPHEKSMTWLSLRPKITPLGEPRLKCGVKQPGSFSIPPDLTERATFLAVSTMPPESKSGWQG